MATRVDKKAEKIIRDWRNDGEPAAEIAHFLNKEGFKNRSGKAWTNHDVNGYATTVLKMPKLHKKKKKTKKPAAQTGVDSYSLLLDIMSSNLGEENKRALVRSLAQKI